LSLPEANHFPAAFKVSLHSNVTTFY
jgi:hypothetical protein